MNYRKCPKCKKETSIMYSGNNQTRIACSCGYELLLANTPTPPVNESWEVEFQKEMMLLCWEIEKLPASEQQTKVVILAGKIKDNLKKFFGEQSTLLSTARQEERERFSGWIAEAFAETNDIVQMQRFLRQKLNTVDSLTYKGGV